MAYSVALAALAAAVLVRWLIEPVLAGTLPFVALFGAVAVAVWAGGYRPALIVTVLGYAACQYLFIRPWGRFDEVQNLVGFTAYGATCLIIVGLGEAMRVSQRRFEDLVREHDPLFPPASVAIESIRRKHNLRDITVIGFASTLAVLVVGGVIGSVNVRRLFDTERQLANSHEVIRQLDALLSTLTDAETGQRGYLLTEDGHYLQLYEEASSRVQAVVARLRQLTSHDAEQQDRLALVEQRTGLELAELRQALTSMKAGDRRTGIDIVRGDGGKASMDGLRRQVAVMRQAEERVLMRRAGESEVSFRAAFVSVVAPALIAITLLGLVFHLGRRSIMARQRTAEVLAEQRERLRVTLASIGDAVITTDAQAHITFLNPVAESTTGWTQDDAIGRPLDTVFRIYDERTRAPAPNPVAKVLREGVVAGLANHTILVRRDGTEVPIDDSAAPICSDAGHLIGCVLVFRDITERRRTDQTLRDSEARLNGIITSATDAIITIDADQRIIVFNAGATAVFGYSSEEMVGQSLDRLIPARFRDIHRRHVAGFGTTGISTRAMGGERVLAGLRRNGEEFPMEARISQFESGRKKFYTVILRDVSERKQAEAEREELLLVAERARAEAEAALNTVGRMQSLTEAALVDLPFDELLQELVRRVCEALAGDTTVLLLVEDGTFLRARAAVGLDDEVRERVRVPVGGGFAGRIAKERRPVVLNGVRYDDMMSRYFRERGIRSVVGVPLVSGQGDVVGVLHVGSIRPRSFGDDEVQLLQLAADRVALAVERAARVDAERRGRELAEASNRAKDEFLAMLGHELRNPLSAVRNAVATASLDESRRPRALDIARRQAEQLGRLIDDLLDVARITQGKIALRKERIHLAQIIERAVDSTRSFLESRGLQLTVTASSVPIRLEVDPARLEQVLVNILSNAGRYTDPGGRIEVVSEQRADEVTIHIRDTGIGIAPEMLPRMWELFTQAERAPDRAHGGLGIGLTVARRLVELHGGRIEAHSEGMGKGAEFVVTLPALPVATDDVRSARSGEPAPQHAARVLIVEDNPDAADSLVMLLEVLGHRVRAVHDGMAALDAARANPPDVMLVDIGLPGMDGYEVARRVRRDPDLKAVVLVALTGYGSPEDTQHAIAAGFDHHLVKPVDPDALHGLVSRLAKEQPDEPPSVH